MSRQVIVTVTGSYVYILDDEDGIVSTPEEAVEDVQDLLDRGQITASDFEINWMEATS